MGAWGGGGQVERVLREGRDVRRRPPFWAHRAACHVLLAADRRLADQLQRVWPLAALLKYVV